MSTSTRQPDILEVIADLSNDEVRTSPRVVNQVLDMLPQEVWTDETLRWLDPGCKTGSFLREVTKRLLVGLEAKIPDEQERLEHILKNMVFGIAITELTALMSRRTLYCSKNASGEKAIVEMESLEGNLLFEQFRHDFENGKCRECSAPEGNFGEKCGGESHAYAFIHKSGRDRVESELQMNFDVIVGNPPYHLEVDSAGQNVASLYPEFVIQAKTLNPRYIAMIIPSRWMAKGRGLDAFRSEMLNDRRIQKLVDYRDPSELFPTVNIRGGICYFLWSRDYSGSCEVTTRRAGEELGPTPRDLNEFDVFVRDARALPILKKVLSAEEPSLSKLVTTRDPFGPALASNFKDYSEVKEPGYLRLYLNKGTKRLEGWVSPGVVTRNKELAKKWKVLVPKAGSGAKAVPDLVIGTPIVSGPNSVCTLTYLAVGPLKGKKEAESLVSYLHTRFCRFLVSLRKPSQDTTTGSYLWVPQQSWDREWNDEDLYEKYGISEQEQAYIAEMIKEMPS